ncbi:MAG TPA: hypothetical protein VID70_06030, partial [Solirubrobacteraceae bacterium]
MSKIKLLFGMAFTLGTMVFSAAPAMAEFESNNGKLSGPATESNFIFTGGGATLQCTTVEGEWKLAAQRSHKEIFTIRKWNNCTVKSKEIKEAKP